MTRHSFSHLGFRMYTQSDPSKHIQSMPKLFDTFLNKKALFWILESKLKTKNQSVKASKCSDKNSFLFMRMILLHTENLSKTEFFHRQIESAFLL